MLAWLQLILAIVFEVAGTTCMKLSEGFTNFWPSIFIFVFYSLSFIALTYATKQIDLSVSYAIWSGIGTSLVAIISVLLFKESMTLIKIISLLMMILGIIGLRL